jgi:uncharacterized protein (DUF1778 family)
MSKNYEEEPITDLDRELAAMLEKATPVKGRVSKNLRFVYSIRLSPDELDEFSRAAQTRGMSVSDFMRTAAKVALQNDLDLNKAKAVSEIKEKARELNEAIERLTA